MASSRATIALLCTLVIMMRPKLIVESGTYHGSATLAMASTAKDNKIDVMIHTADPIDHKKLPKLAKVHGLRDIVTFWQCEFLDMLQQIAGDIDLAYIDGGVRLPQVQATRPRLAKHGLIVVDDTEENVEWQGLKKIRKMASINLPFERGISIIER